MKNYKLKTMGIKFLIMLLALSFVSTSSMAKSKRMLFWYPGGEGSSEDAQPILDAFSEYVNLKIAPDKIDCHYINSQSEGLKYIKKKKPILLITSFAAQFQNKSIFKDAKVILRTLPLPTGKSDLTYIIVKGCGTKFGNTLPVVSSESLTLPFIKTYFPKLNRNITVKQSENIFGKLKAISEGSSTTAIILNPMEAYTIKHLSSPWTKKIETFSKSTPIPSASVLALTPSWNGIQRLKTTLISMNKNENGKNILEELRLKGFTNP